MTQTIRLAEAAWLRAPALTRAFAVLNEGGEEARVVGGAARNALLGLPLSDIDIATTALPEEVIRRAAAAGFKAVPTGIEHGTVTLVIDAEPFEVTTLRQDVETFGRKAKVAFGRDWRADAERRDFTINALSIASDGTVHDYVGGLADVAAHRVRFIGDPARRIAEDYLRILRFFRFHAAYAGGAPDAAGLAACIAARHGLHMLSRERLRTELMKLLVAPFAVPTLAVMADSGFIEMLLGSVPHLKSFANMVELEGQLAAPDAVRRLSALGVLIVEDADRLRQRLRLFNAEYERLAAMGDGWWRISPALGEGGGRGAGVARRALGAGEARAGEVRGAEGARGLLYRLGPAHYFDRVLLAWTRAGTGAADPAWRALASLPSHWQAPPFPLRAADFIVRNVPRGPALGQAMRASEAAWIAAGFPRDKPALEAIADAAALRT